MSDMLQDILVKSVEGVVTMADAQPTQQMAKEEKRRMLTERMPQEQIDIAEAAREEFISVWNEKVVPVRGEQAERLLSYLDGKSCDFFIAPASARNHGAHFGGLVMHSLNVYRCLQDVLDSRIYKAIGLEPSEDTVAIVALLHDLCKANFYSYERRNRKNATGQWESYPYITYNDSFPYGHGEKSVYMVSQFMRLSAEEAMAIRHHMGFSDCTDKQEKGVFSQAARKYPLCVAMSEADTRATLVLEGFWANQLHSKQVQDAEQQG